MPIEIIPGDQAWATYRGNALARWPTRDDAARLHPLASPRAPRGFALRGDERVFCIGSCFARSIENALKELGFDVLSIMENLPRSPNRDRSDRGMFNKYNVATILNELRWAFGEGAPYRHEDVLIAPPGDLLLQDYQLAGPGYADEPGFARRFREEFNAAFQSIRRADVVVLTLGLSEAWLDRATGLYLNAAPMEHLVAAYPGRYELHVLDHAETIAMLAEIDRLLVANLQPGFRLMVTVSPVPLWSTFRDQDVLTANTYSKSVLRTAIDHFVAGRPHASYFPSFEFAALSNPLTVWERADFRHVDPYFVDFIMQSVLLQFGGLGADTAAARERTRAKLLERAGFDARGELSASRSLGARLRQLGRRLDAWRKARRRARAEQAAPVRGYLDRWDGSTLTGWVFVPGQATPARVTVLVDGREVATALADLEREDVAREHGEAWRRSGFHIPVDRASVAGTSLSVRVGQRILKTLPLQPE
jgi:hypothetical protein